MMMPCLPSGSPTAELFAASYNNRSNKSKTIELGLGTYGYTENTNRHSDDWFKPEDNHGIYNNGSHWWLASPYFYRDGDELIVSYGGDFSYSEVASSLVAVRPLVCIPTSVFDSKYATSLVNE